jgi:hypothetical protein
MPLWSYPVFLRTPWWVFDLLISVYPLIGGKKFTFVPLRLKVSSVFKGFLCIPQCPLWQGGHDKINPYCGSLLRFLNMPPRRGAGKIRVRESC